jgi:glutamate racemase
MCNNPIGIFDSGIGGLTIAYALKKSLPNESFIYFGDTKHLPYGEKSDKAIKQYSLSIARFLKSKNCKAIIIACNSASSVAYKVIKTHITDIPIYNVIDPVVDSLKDQDQIKKIGVIGTKATIKSNVYEKKINQRNKLINVVSLETPLLAPMIEEGFFNQEISTSIIKNYLDNKSLDSINALILACTHYPLIKEEINKLFNSKIHIIDSTEIITRHIKEEMKKLNIKSSSNKSYYHFIVSNFTESFEKSASFFFKENIKLEEIDIWK